MKSDPQAKVKASGHRLRRFVGLFGEFTSGTSHRVLTCRVTGIEDFDAEMLTIDYVTHHGDKITGAAIPAWAFRPDKPNAAVLAQPGPTKTEEPK